MKKKQIIISFIIGFLIALTVLGFKTYSDHSNPTITCSNDGKYVYIVDLKYVYISSNFGGDWEKIDLSKK